MKNKTGLVMMVIGILHSILGFVKYQHSFGTMISQGLFNTAVTTEAKLSFWFTFAGLLFICLGFLMYLFEEKGFPIDKSFGWFLIGCATIGVIFLPVSGFWLVFLPAILTLNPKTA